MFAAVPDDFYPAGRAVPDARHLGRASVAVLFRAAVRLSLELQRVPGDLPRRSGSAPYPWVASLAASTLKSAYRPVATRSEAAPHPSPPCRFPQAASLPFRSD